jgi:hypothetical protein
MNLHTSLHGTTGRETIDLAEHDHDYRYYNEVNGPFHFHSAFVGYAWDGFFDFGGTGGGHQPPVPQDDPSADPCRRLEQFRNGVSQEFDAFLKAQQATLNPSWWKDPTPTKDDWGKAVVGGVLGLAIFKNAAGAAIGVGLSIAGNVIYTEGQNIIDPRNNGDYMNFQKTWSAFTAKAEKVQKEMGVTAAERKTWANFQHNGGNCGGAGGSW